MRKGLLQFIAEPDPFLAMLKWVMTEMMRIEVEAKAGAAKGKHSKDRTTHFSGGRARRVDTRMCTVHLVVPKIRKGGYVQFYKYWESHKTGEGPAFYLSQASRRAFCWMVGFGSGLILNVRSVLVPNTSSVSRTLPRLE